MSYLVLARKYRPQTFDDIVAQEHVTRTLQNSITNGRVGSGYLFCGPRGTGKTTSARILAKGMNCINGPTATPCNECPACIEITKGNSLDVLEIDAASNTGVDDVRALRENIRYLPTGGKKRIYIIDEVHRLSGAAFDALLKTLEEPPPHVMFVFATTEPLKVPETILSRTQRFDFKRVTVEQLAANMSRIAKKERLDIDQAALRLLARKADGSVRDSLSLLDQVAAFASGRVDEAVVTEALGLVDRQLLIEFVSILAERDSKGAIGLVDRVFDAGIDPSDFVAELLEHLRLLMAVTTDRTLAGGSGLTEEEQEAVIAQAERFGLGDIIRFMRLAAELNRDLKDSGLDERLLLELAAVRMTQLEATVDLRRALDNLESASGVAHEAPPIEKKKFSLSRPAPDVAAEPRPEPAQAAGVPPLTLLDIQPHWESFLDNLATVRPIVAANIRQGVIREVGPGRLVLAFPPRLAAARDMLERRDNQELFQEAFLARFGLRLPVQIVVDENVADSDPELENRQRQAELLQSVANSSRIKMLLEKVDGQIIGVRKVE